MCPILLTIYITEVMASKKPATVFIWYVLVPFRDCWVVEGGRSARDAVTPGLLEDHDLGSRCDKGFVTPVPSIIPYLIPDIPSRWQGNRSETSKANHCPLILQIARKTETSQLNAYLYLLHVNQTTFLAIFSSGLAKS